MNKTDLIGIIKKLVKDEVREQLPSLLMEAISATVQDKTKTPPPKKSVEVATNKGISMQPKREVVRETQNIEPKFNLKNSALNSILNETISRTEYERNAGFNPTSVSQVDYAEMDSQSRLEAMLPKQNTSGGQIQVQADQIPNSLANALTKDYSKFLKVVDKAASSRRP